MSGRHLNAADLILYADHLEDRVRRLEEVIVWLSRTFEYEDPETGEEISVLDLDEDFKNT